MSTTRIPGGGIGRNPFGPQRVVDRSSAVGSLGQQVEDSLFGRRRPALLPLDEHAEPLLLRLDSYRRRLAKLVGDLEDDYRLVLAEGTIASIDVHGTIFVGRTFLLDTKDDLDVQVGILAHEIGHRPKRWKEYRSSRPLSPSEVREIARLEETRADFFSGYALALFGLDCEHLCSFLQAAEERPHPEYLPAMLRAATIREAHAMGLRRSDDLERFFPDFARMTSVRSDLGEA